MTLSILLPFRVFADRVKVLRIVADTSDGSFGLLPHRRDCVAALTPGILIYETDAHGEVLIAVDHGVLVKTGLDVMVSVRRALPGSDLASLHQAVIDQFLTVGEQERKVRAVVDRLESGILHRFASLNHA
jgi:F-type H+-transporting ATPase subunit epsilon